jgi:hypothetical protein
VKINDDLYCLKAAKKALIKAIIALHPDYFEDDIKVLEDIRNRIHLIIELLNEQGST